MGYGVSGITGDGPDNPFWGLPLSDRRCMNASCEAFVIGYNKSQARYPNSEFLHYGLWTVYFWAAIILIFSYLHLRHRLADLNKTKRVLERLQALWRSFTYQRLTGSLGEQVDISYGLICLLALATAFLCVMPFYQGFYLREQFRFGSPPLSVRCAILMSALTPPLMMLAGKMNILTLLTGVSYAKLNIWHRFVGYAIFCLSIVHTVPHLIAPIKEGGIAELSLLYQMQRREFSGTFLFGDFVCLVVFSLPYFRNMAYEYFKHGHIVLALGWFGLIFWHIRNELVAPGFFYSAFGVWACSVLARIIYRNRFLYPFTNVTAGYPTTLEHLPGNMTRVAVQVPAKMRWKPGQHCYIAIPGISSIGNHPFTIASIPNQKSSQDNNEVVLLIRECGGFTKMLGAHSKLDFEGKFAEMPMTPTSPGMTLNRTNGRDSTIGLALSSDSPSNDLLSPNRVGRSTLSRNSSRGSFIEERAASNSNSPITAPLSITLTDRDSFAASSFTARGPVPSYRKSSVPPSFLSTEADIEAQQALVTTWVDGPFGEYTRPIHRHYEGFVTIAGGSGLTASLPWLCYLTEKMKKAAQPGDYDCAMRRVTFIWSIRKAEWITWARRELIWALRAAAQSKGMFRAIIYVTSKDADENVAKAIQLDLTIAAGLSEGIERSTLEIRYGRPQMKEVLTEVLDGKRNMVRVCGPNALKAGVSNTVAHMQKLVLEKRVQSISLDGETFGW
ncbi:metalloreductase transmembrane component [Venturia nashicola]|uniref:ferric-chelate reductase (NADPH) n=1 Tax=Venturia nashicola TaxID=86259 RepID=A0A4Z1P1V6_9PEZI|nr:metalloreductase transmembrane component [Venturia nashicola]TLD34516.1 metalloreductase transmembrane component [Venturia nashicola]